MSFARRFSLVSSFFALRTQNAAALRYHGAWARKNSQAFLFARNWSSKVPLNSADCLCSYEYIADRSSVRCSNALSPAGCIRPRLTSSLARSMFTALQTLPGFRLVNRIVYLASSTLFRTASIQPKQRASSTDSGHVILGLPELLL